MVYDTCMIPAFRTHRALAVTATLFLASAVLVLLGTVVWILNRAPETIPPPPLPQVATYKDMVVVETPLPESRISSPLTIRGKARGNWFFEASFPVILTNWDGLIIAEGHAQADGEWMTTDFVPFTATLNFEKPNYGERGALILKKDNPSGLPEHDDAFEMTVFFK